MNDMSAAASALRPELDYGLSVCRVRETMDLAHKEKPARSHREGSYAGRLSNGDDRVNQWQDRHREHRQDRGVEGEQTGDVYKSPLAGMTSWESLKVPLGSPQGTAGKH